MPGGYFVYIHWMHPTTPPLQLRGRTRVWCLTLPFAIDISVYHCRYVFWYTSVIELIVGYLNMYIWRVPCSKIRSKNQHTFTLGVLTDFRNTQNTLKTDLQFDPGWPRLKLHDQIGWEQVPEGSWPINRDIRLAAPLQIHFFLVMPNGSYMYISVYIYIYR